VASNVYCYGIKAGGQAEWDYVWKKFEETNIANEQDSFLRALACASDTGILSR
jgi:aminopeptidase N